MPKPGTCRADLGRDSLTSLRETFLFQVEKLEFLSDALLSCQIVELRPLRNGLEYNLQLSFLPIFSVSSCFDCTFG